METTDYCSYELSKALKAAGFDEPCDHYWYKVYTNSDEMEICQAVADDYNNDGWSVPHCSAPHIYHAQKWLREKWGIHVDACVFSDYSTDADGKVCDRWDFWGFDLYAVVGGEKMIDDDGEYDSYEQALSAGISAALELIKKGE